MTNIEAGSGGRGGGQQRGQARGQEETGQLRSRVQFLTQENAELAQVSIVKSMNRLKVYTKCNSKDDIVPK